MSRHNEARPASITLVRHGESVANRISPKCVEDIPVEWRGTPDHKVPLTDTGREQAARTAIALADRHPEGFDDVYFSPYLRTRQTAEAMVAAFPAAQRARLAEACRPDMFLREQAFGYADVMAATETTFARHEEAYSHFEHHRATAGKFYTRPDNGDSWADVCQRTHTFLGKLFREPFRDRHVLVVSHAVTIATFRYHLERLSEDEVVDVYQHDRLRNCSAGRFEHSPAARPRWPRPYWNWTA